MGPLKDIAEQVLVDDIRRNLESLTAVFRDPMITTEEALRRARVFFEALVWSMDRAAEMVSDADGLEPTWKGVAP